MQFPVVVDSRRLIVARPQPHAAGFDQRIRGVDGVAGLDLRQRRREREHASRTNPVGDGLDAGVTEAGPLAIQFRIAALETVHDVGQHTCRQRTVGHRSRDLRQLRRESHVDLAFDDDIRKLEALPFQAFQCLGLQPEQVLLDPDRIERSGGGIGQLCRQDNVGRGQAERRERRRDLAQRHHDVAHADLGGIAGAVSGPGAAEGVEDEVSRVVPGLHYRLAEQVTGLRVLHRIDRGGRILDRHAQGLRDLDANRSPRQLDVEPLLAPQ